MLGLEPSEFVGQVLESRYRIEQHLGSGAMGSVFRARHVRLPRAFAVKLLHPRLLSDTKLRKRFVREAELAGRLSHRNVVAVLDFGEVQDAVYLVMELAIGSPLSLALAHTPFDSQRMIHFARQLCDGLDHAHHHGLVHRDLKPDNVIVESTSEGDVARIIDFGIALLRESTDAPGERLTTGGLVLGTPHYMAPEVATSKAFDHRADLFALGVICYEMLTGRLPFDGDGVDVAHANVNQDVPPMRFRAPGIDVLPALEAFTRKLLARDPANRFVSAAAARRCLDDIARDVAENRDWWAAQPTVTTPAVPDSLAIGSAKTVAIATLEQPRVTAEQPPKRRDEP
ncbi:MAG TPA: serine/threonine-protein kinase [Kofleriaceae bacterium]|nr:serine/threonine-protein kinase [Kofleriaceae bacterium]